MSEVTFSVGGREYTVACAEGEEDHVGQLGAEIDAKLRGLGSDLSPKESQNLIFAALLLADELHETKKTADDAQSEQQRQQTELESARKEASLATGKRDELVQTVSQLESELEGLQSAQQRHSAEVDDMRTELGQRREEAETSAQEAERLTASVVELTRERDTLAKQITNKDELLDRANSLIQSTKAELAEARNGAVLEANGSEADDPNLAPALERFADLLENCADKLEGKPANA